MKRKDTKRTIISEERNVAKFLRHCLDQGGRETDPPKLAALNSAFVYLLTTHLKLTWLSYYNKWWLDDVEWSSLHFLTTIMSGKGTLWFGCRADPSAAMMATAFQAELELRPRRLSYSVTFEAEGIKFSITSRDRRSFTFS